MDNQRFILYVALALILFLIWQAWQRDYSVNPPVAQSIDRSVTTANGAMTEDVPMSSESATSSMSNATSVAVPSTSTDSSNESHTLIQVETDVYRLAIDSKGADIETLFLKTYPVSLEEPDHPLQLLTNDHTVYVTQSGLLHDRIGGESFPNRAPNHHAVYQTPQNAYQLVDGEDSLIVPFVWTNGEGVKVTKTYHFKRGSFLIDVDYLVENESDTVWTGRQYRQLRRSDVTQDRSLLRLPTYTGTAYYDGEYEKYSFSDIRDKKLAFEYSGGWVAMLQHYFVSAWIPGEDENNFYYSNEIAAQPLPEYIIGIRSDPIQIAPGTNSNLSTRLYIGPKLQESLEEIKESLELTTDYGMFTPLAKPLFWLLDWFHNWVNNWGVAIILVTLLIKLVFYKLSESSYRSMAKMRKVQPRFKVIRERYADDKQKLNQAMWELYRKEKINPLGGCLPILIQMPVFLSLYWVLVETVELRQSPFIFWIQDLSIKDPFFVLPVLMGITMFIQFKLNPTPPDPVQEKVFMMMPIFMTAFMAFFPAGLVLYWFVNNLLSIAQQWVITRRIEKQS